MRRTRPGVTAGTIQARLPLSGRTLTRAAIVAAALWMAWAFAQEAWTAHRLSAQVAALHQQNAALASQNQSYARDISTVQSGGASEEVARENGYAKPGEHVYVVASPTPAGTGGTVVPRPSVQVVNTSAGPFDGVARWWSHVLHGR